MHLVKAIDPTRGSLGPAPRAARARGLGPLRTDLPRHLSLEALTENQRIEAVFKFFRPSLIGDGTTQMFFQIELGGGRLASQQIILPDTLVPAVSFDPPMEEVSIVFQTIMWTYTDGGISHRDSWDQNR